MYMYMYVGKILRKKRTTVDNLEHMRLCLEDPKVKEGYCRQIFDISNGSHFSQSGGMVAGGAVAMMTPHLKKKNSYETMATGICKINCCFGYSVNGQ